MRPNRPFSFQSGTYGAFELKARYSELSLNEDTFADGDDSFADPTTAAEAAQAFAVGLNWYLNQNVKSVLDYEQTMFDGGGAVRPMRQRISKTKKSFSVGCSSTFNPA